MPLYKAIISDLFNTLVSVGDVPLSVGRLTADILDVDADEWNNACFGALHEVCQPTRHVDVIKVLAWSLNPDISLARIEQASDERQARFDHALVHAQASTLSALTALRQRGLRLALVSNASTGEVAAWQGSPLAPFFDHAVFSCECGYKKPELAIYQLALESLGIAASECLYVGDGGSQEFRGAREAGLYTVLTSEFLKPMRYQRVLAEQAGMIDTEVTCLRELLRIIEA